MWTPLNFKMCHILPTENQYVKTKVEYLQNLPGFSVVFLSLVKNRRGNKYQDPNYV